MRWVSIRVSKYTRALHPDDYQEGLPQPGPLEDADRYEEMVVGKNESLVWIGKNWNARQWLITHTPMEQRFAEAANKVFNEQPDLLHLDIPLSDGGKFRILRTFKEAYTQAKHTVYANDAKGKAPRKKATTKRKQKPLPKQTMEDAQPKVSDEGNPAA
jgi:hypothetical protein